MAKERKGKVIKDIKTKEIDYCSIKDLNKPSLFKRIVLKHRISKYLNTFINAKYKEMKYFKSIEKEPSIKLKDLLKSLREYVGAYTSELSRFDQLEKEIEEHNQEINSLKSYNFKRNPKDFYDNPTNYKENDFEDDLKISESIKKYIGVDHNLNLKVDEIIKLVNNYVLINEEYSLHEKYNRLISLNDSFYDSRQVVELIKDLNVIKNELNGKELFYEFNLFDENKLNEYILKHNNNFLQCHINDPIFNNINGKSLDIEQKTAILKDETSVLTIAGAGSGKTLTICGKLKYLLNNGVDPKDILLLSYSKKSADDLENKAKSIDSKLTVGTFHKIGLEILEENVGKKFMVEDQFNAIIEKYFREEMHTDPSAMKDILRYHGLFLKLKSEYKKYDNEGELYEDLKSSDFKTLRDFFSNISGDRDKKTTIKKEKVKSIEELEIANFYFLNGIDYIYENPYEIEVGDKEHRQYTPDFYLKDYGIYHEHYGVDKNGKATQYKDVEARRYEEGILWKREIHNTYQTKCLETFSYQFSDGTIYDNLTKLLKENDVKFNPLKPKEIERAVNSIYEEGSFASFINLIISFISLYKARYKDSTSFDSLKNSSFPNIYQKDRASLFLNICKRIYAYYIDYLNKEGKIDFDDMILKSKELVYSLPNFKYKYIIVDEFQDISYSRMEFLKALIKHGNSKLFAVGDDWQAIYRFSGCDLGLFLNFEKYFGKSVINYITSTHRNSQELQDIAGPFIKMNSQQMNKAIKSEKHLDKPIKLVYINDDKYTAFQQVLTFINKSNPNANILVLGRNNKDVEDILSNSLRIKNSFGVKTNSILSSKEYPGFKIIYSTVHGSKGLEEDYTIIINADDKTLGFPNKMEDDPLLNLVLSEGNQMEYAEERRLWYVALTRTRNYCYVLVDAKYPSQFVEEIKEQCEIINDNCLEKVESPLLCPHCKSGRLIMRKNKHGKEFYGCSNYPYCEYTIDDILEVGQNIRCPNCGDFIIKKYGKYGNFYGCHGYPYCKYKVNIGSNKK